MGLMFWFNLCFLGFLILVVIVRLAYSFMRIRKAQRKARAITRKASK